VKFPSITSAKRFDAASFCAAQGIPMRLRRKPPPNGLRTMRDGAARLGCSVKTLKGHIASGALSYVIIGHGSKRPRKMLTDADLDLFVVNQTRKDAPACQYDAIRARHTGNSTSKSEVIAFSDRRKLAPVAKRKR
jgi:hypothetical protein